MSTCFWCTMSELNDGTASAGSFGGGDIPAMSDRVKVVDEGKASATEGKMLESVRVGGAEESGEMVKADRVNANADGQEGKTNALEGKMADGVNAKDKEAVEGERNTGEGEEENDEERPRRYYKKRKVALFISYCGGGYQASDPWGNGMEWNERISCTML